MVPFSFLLPKHNETFSPRNPCEYEFMQNFFSITVAEGRLDMFAVEPEYFKHVATIERIAVQRIAKFWRLGGEKKESSKNEIGFSDYPSCFLGDGSVTFYIKADGNLPLLLCIPAAKDEHSTECGRTESTAGEAKTGIEREKRSCAGEDTGTSRGDG